MRSLSPIRIVMGLLLWAGLGLCLGLPSAAAQSLPDEAPRALHQFDTDWTQHTIDLSTLKSGGPSKDQIRALTFQYEEKGRFTDQQTGSTWTVTERATDGPFDGTQLARIEHGDYFAFAWFAFGPTRYSIPRTIRNRTARSGQAPRLVPSRETASHS